MAVALDPARVRKIKEEEQQRKNGLVTQMKREYQRSEEKCAAAVSAGVVWRSRGSGGSGIDLCSTLPCVCAQGDGDPTKGGGEKEGDARRPPQRSIRREPVRVPAALTTLAVRRMMDAPAARHRARTTASPLHRRSRYVWSLRAWESTVETVPIRCWAALEHTSQTARNPRRGSPREGELRDGARRRAIT